MSAHPVISKRCLEQQRFHRPSKRQVYVVTVEDVWHTPAMCTRLAMWPPGRWLYQRFCSSCWCWSDAVVDPEVLARGGESKGHKGGEAAPSPDNLWILKVGLTVAHFCALLNIDFKVYRLINETVSGHIRRTLTNCLCFPLLFQSLRGKNQEVLR